MGAEIICGACGAPGAVEGRNGVNLCADDWECVERQDAQAVPCEVTGLGHLLDCACRPI